MELSKVVVLLLCIAIFSVLFIFDFNANVGTFTLSEIIIARIGNATASRSQSIRTFLSSAVNSSTAGPVASTKEQKQTFVTPPVSLTTASIATTATKEQKQTFITPPVNLTSVPSCVPHHEYMTNLMSKKKGKWTSKNMTILLLSAFDYDTHVIVTTQSEGWYGKRVFCRFLSSNFTEVGTATAGMSFPEYTVNCCARKDKFAYISVTEKADDPIVQYVPVVKRNVNTFKYGLSMCLAPIYGDQSTFLMLTELIEHYKLQGVEHFYVYVHEMEEYSMRLLHDYTRTGEVEAFFHDWRKDRPGADWQLVGVMDCLHRSRFHSKHAIFADLDERITPSSNISLAEFARKKFDANPKVGLLSFRPRWILRDRIPPKKYEGMKTLNSDLPILVFHNTSGWPGPGHTSKCILDPIKTLIMWVHYANEMFEGFEQYNVPPEEAVIRHYRDVAISNWGTRWMPETLAFGNYTNTYYPPHLQKILVKNVALRLDRVYAEKLT